MHNHLINDARPEAALVLADGAVFKGRSIGVSGMAVGEVVFNTAMTGYQEILTDPSYTGQIVTLTYPHIGNVGVNQDDVESSDVHVAGLVIRSESPVVSNWRGQRSLTEYLKQKRHRRTGRSGHSTTDTHSAYNRRPDGLHCCCRRRQTH